MSDLNSLTEQEAKYMESDKELLAKYGEAGLAKLGYVGVLDRLRRAGVLPPANKTSTQIESE